MSLIACREVSFAYEGVTVIEKLSFEVNDGDYLCVVGENGSGKSTLVKGLLHLKQPIKGSIHTGGIKTGEIGYLPQQTAAQKDFPASAYEVVLSGRLGRLGAHLFYSKADKEAAAEAMERFEITSVRGRRFGDLSGGQRQRVLLARALCAAQKLLVLDEPAAGLDALASRELHQLIDQLNREGLTVIMVSHDVRGAVERASHILHLQNSQAFFGTATEYIQSGIGTDLLGGWCDA